MRIFISLIILLLTSSSVWATTYYIRDQGGSVYGTSQATNTCNGTANVVYSFGASPNCAVNNPTMLLGFGCGNFGTGTCGVSRIISGGDTVNIDGDSDSSPGSQAQYQIGYVGVPNSDCQTSFEYDCTLGNLPAGTDSSHPTSLIGIGTHRPMLLAVNTPWQVINANNNNITLQNIEITDNSATAYNNPVLNGRNASGIELGGTSLALTDIYVHGMNAFGIVTVTLGNATLTRVWIIGNGYGGITVGNSDSTSITGTLTLNQPIIDWNGCVEAYPLTGGIDNPSNYSQCFGQDSGGYGDGLAFGPSGSTNAGNWTIIGPGSISFNTQDGLDVLHGNGNGTMQVDKMRFEGNAGQQVKLNGLTSIITNSVVIGDCGWWNGASQSASGAMGNGDTCRANGDAIVFNVTNNSVTTIYNNTILSNGNITMGSKDINSTGCNGSTAIHVKNNIVYGGLVWDQDSNFIPGGADTSTTYIYNNGNDGNGGGTCGTLTWDEDYNIVQNTKSSNAGCVGTHDKCGTSPGFVNALPMGVYQGALNTFYQGQAGVTYMPISIGSAAKGSGVSGLTYWNTINDYYNNGRTTPSMGALEYGSLAANTFAPCFFNSDCSSNMCTANVCVGGSATGDNYNNLIIKGISFK